MEIITNKITLEALKQLAIEFDSMINLRPAQNNRSRGVEDSKLREKIIQIGEKIYVK